MAVDIGNVCVSIAEARCAQLLGFSSMAELTHDVPELLVIAARFEAGRVTEHQFIEAVSEALPAPRSHDDIRTAYCALIGDEIAGMKIVIRRIIGLGYTPVFLSDISSLHFRHVRSILSFSDDVRTAVVSYEVGELKPHSAMFTAMETQFCENRVPALYLDDKAENIAAASERGWIGYQVGTVDGIHAALDTMVANADHRSH